MRKTFKPFVMPPSTKIMRQFCQIFFVLLILFNGAVTSQAGETSKANVLGFTKDGSYFAFEEYGIGDGLGLPYVTVFGLEVAKDKWLPGSPVRLALRESDPLPDNGDLTGDASAELLAQTREKAVDKAQSFLQPLGALGHGSLRAHNVPWHVGNDTRLVRFTSVDLIPSDKKVWRLELEQSNFPAREDCFGFADNMKGFRLRLTDEVTGISRLINNDVKIPRSRPCPLGYSIEQVWTHQGIDAPAVFAILIRFQTVGFEGPDGRLLAITGLLQ